jgi:hypothetical protein
MTTATNRLLRGALVLGLAATLPGFYLGLFLVGQDLQESGEFLDGVGVAYGLMVVAAMALPALLAGRALVLSLRNRTTAPRWAFAAALTGLVDALLAGWWDALLLATVLVPLFLAVVALARLHEQRARQSR